MGNGPPFDPEEVSKRVDEVGDVGNYILIVLLIIAGFLALFAYYFVGGTR